MLAELLNGDDDRVGVLPTHPGQFAADALVDVVAVVLDVDVDDEGPQFVHEKESVRPV